MNYPNRLNTYSLQQKLHKVCRQLQQLMHTVNVSSARQFRSLIKRRDRYLQQLLSSGPSLTKASGALAFALFLSAQIHAQKCSNYDYANAANPLIKALQAGSSDPAFVDIDGDGDLDCYVSGSDGYLTFYRNVGTAKVPYYIKDAGSGLSAPTYAVSGAQFADFDGDGDFDCFIPDGQFIDTWRVLYYENTGTKTHPVFVRNDAANPLAFVKGAYSLFLTLADIDNDGDYDVFYSDTYYSKVFQNTGTKTAPAFQEIYFKSGGFNSRIYLDWNKDGRVDYLDYGGISFHRNTGNLHYVNDPSGPSFPPAAYETIHNMVDINNDGMLEAFSYNSGLLTTTPAPVITNGGMKGSKTELLATPQNTQYRYQWQRNGKNISGAMADSILTSVAGYYTVAITDSCGTGVSLPYGLKTNAATFDEAESSVLQFSDDIKESALPSLHVYPNPFTQQFSLDFGKYCAANTTIRITDAQGRIISTTTVIGTFIKLGSNLPKGMYLVQILQNNRIVSAQKILKE